MRFNKIKARVRSLAEVAAWPLMGELIDKIGHRESLSVWEYPVAACEAVGGSAEAALPGAAAVFCSVISIHLVDDILDEDPAGEHHRLGVGRTANLGLAFQAAGHRLLDDPALSTATRAALQASFAAMSLATAFGQDLDARDLCGEEEYWRVVDAKTPPLFAAAFEMGALLGGATGEVASQLADLGRALGRYVQVSDDLSDALQTPAKADWNRPANNLPILYAMTVDHADRDQFLLLSKRVDDAESLNGAQKILLRSGAASYCTLKLIQFAQEAAEILARIPLSDPQPLARILAEHKRPLRKLLASVGLDEPAALVS